jgi:hypothetical protein
VARFQTAFTDDASRAARRRAAMIFNSIISRYDTRQGKREDDRT